MFLRKISTRTEKLDVKFISKTIAGICLSISLAQASENSVSAINNQTIRLPQTGQTPTLPIPAIPGTDGYTYIGVPWAYNPYGPLTPLSRFTIGTGAQSDCITDNLTGLMWVRNPPYIAYTWDNAIKSTASGGAIPSSLCGYTDWRLPNINELSSLINDGYTGEHGQAEWLQSQGFGFPGIDGVYYWSSSTSTINAPGYSIALAIGMFEGDVGNWSKTVLNYVLPVRDGLATAPAQVPQTGQTSTSPINPAPAGSDGNLRKGVAWPTPRFIAGSGAEDQCMTDNLTGLMWARNADLFDGVRPVWKRALKYVNDMNTVPQAPHYDLCGHTDWRLPNKNELKSLMNWGSLGGTVSWLRLQGFNIPDNVGYYWTSSAHLPINKTNAVWVINILDGSIDLIGEEPGGLPIWPVRSGQ